VALTTLSGRFEKTLLVSSAPCDEVEEVLRRQGCVITRVSDGNSAVQKASKQFFDAVVVISTGKDMDLIETVLNLRDVRWLMKIIMLADWADASGNSLIRIATKVPNTIVVNLEGLRYLLPP
jgi:CheY-like chemotaxis protein